MSGLEITGVVFGVLPILIEAVKAYSSVCDSFYTFRHYSREMKRIRVQFQVHRGIFMNECRLILRLVEDERGASTMLENLDGDKRWTSKEINDRLNEALKDSFDLCRCIIEASKEVLDEMREELASFDIIVQKKAQDESIRAAIRRLRDAVRITFDKSKHEKSLTALRDRNMELAQLRSHIGAFHQHSVSVESKLVSRHTLPPRFNSIRTASQKLHEALSSAWCCGNLSHASHSAKICLDAEVDAEVRLNLAIACQEAPCQQREQISAEPLIWLYVQSISIDTVDCTIQSGAVAGMEASMSQKPNACSSLRRLKKKASTELTVQSTIKKCRKKVHFKSDDIEQHNPASLAGETQNDIAIAISQTVSQQSTVGINLCQTKNICHYLKQNLQICGKLLDKHCVGYLESPQMYRHVFYLQEKSLNSDSKPKDSSSGFSYPVSDLLRQDEDEVLNIVDQLKLAHKMAVATLQFNDTPWLVRRWRLKDLSYFGNTSTYKETVLKTLHLSSQIASGDSIEASNMEGVETVAQAYSEEDLFGINNMTLFSLGIALLELAHWKSIESLGNSKDPNTILTARRVSARSTRLGPKYRDIVRKCLQCNFGFGTDLNKKELQAAVYGNVICPLEKMIETLSI